jgi:hypothetical protein
MEITREQWLNKLVDRARPMFKANEASLPEVRAALTPPHRKMKAVGLCWHDEAAEDKAREIWISSAIDDAFEVAGVLVHELCHAALPHNIKHKKPFITLARKFHLEGKPTATTIGDPFKKIWLPIIEKIGPLPGAKFLGAVPVDGRGKQSIIQQRNVACPECEFAAKVRLDQMSWGRLKCPVDGIKLLMKCEMEGE